MCLQAILHGTAVGRILMFLIEAGQVHSKVLRAQQVEIPVPRTARPEAARPEAEG
jgi:hypothetical protein